MTNRMPHWGRVTLTTALTTALAASVALAPLRASAADGTIRFGIQPWPGVTVKAQIVTQILEAMGYSTNIKNVGTQFVYQGISSDELDVSLGAWMPAHKPMVQPLLDEGTAVKLGINLKGAIQGLAVPTYVYESGIQSLEDLIANGDRFDHTIYAIGAGAAMTEKFEEAVQADYMGLGDWTVLPSSTAGMLAQVGRKTSQNEAIVFHGWRPHWMAIKYDIRFLAPGPKGNLAGMKSTVYNIVSNEFPEQYPEAAQFIKRVQVSPETQSQWIYDLSYEDRPEDAVASEWIKGHMDKVAQWLEGVQTASGGSGIEAVRKAFAG